MMAISKIAVARHIAASEITMISRGPLLSATAPPINISVILGTIPPSSPVERRHPGAGIASGLLARRPGR